MANTLAVKNKRKKTNEQTKQKRERVPMDAGKLQESMTEQQKEMYRRILSLNDSVQLNELNSARKFGEAIAEVCAEHNAKTYGKQFVTVLSKLLNHSSAYLYERMRFYERISPTQFVKLLGLRLASTNTPLTYSHVVAVLDLPENLFWDYLNKTATNSYTVSQLKSLVREHKNPQGKKNGRGRAVNVPADFKGQIDNIEQSLSPLIKRAKHWNDEKVGVEAVMAKLDKAKLDKQWATRLGQLANDVEAAVNQLQTLKATLGKMTSNLTTPETPSPKENGPSWRDDATLSAMGFE